MKIPFRLTTLGWIGLLLFSVSIYPTILLLLEISLSHYINNKIEERFEIGQSYLTQLGLDTADDPYNPDYVPPFELGKNKVEIKLTNLHPETMKFPYEYQKIGDIEIYLNGKLLDRLTRRILVNGAEEFKPYTAEREIDVYPLFDRKEKNSKVLIIETITPRKIGYSSEGGYEYVYEPISSVDEKYRAYLVEPNGEYKKIEFAIHGYHHSPERMFLAMQVSDKPFGYYTTALYSYPIFYFPFTYPFGICLLGILFLISGIRKKKYAQSG